MGLSQDTAQRAARHFSMLRNYGSYKTIGGLPCKLYVTSCLSSLVKSGLQQLASEFAVGDRLHAAISSSKWRTLGSTVAVGGAK